MSKLLKPINPNAGLIAKYKRAMLSLIDEMSNSVEYWLTAQYNKAPPRLAQDATPSDDMQKRLRKLAEDWQIKFDALAPKLAELYVKGAFKHADSAFQRALLDAGWSVKFKLTPAMRDALNASMNANVGLIKSIPQEYFKQVEGVVMRSYTAGRDLKTMTDELKLLYPKAAHRAEIIARDQSNKANATANRTRRLELGLEEAIWMHSSAGKEPRASHVTANGKKYKIAEGCKIEGEFIFPGEKPNCRCTDRVVLPF